jgi:hypothetical protein
LQSQIDTEISGRIRSAAARRKRSLEQLQNHDQAQQAAPNYIQNRKLFESVVAQDKRIIGALQSYRSSLCLQKKSAGQVFVRVDPDDRDRSVTLDAAGYLQLPIELRYI